MLGVIEFTGRSKIIIKIIMAFAAAAFFGTNRGFAAEKFDLSEYDGPRMKDLYYVITRNMDAALLAMSTGKLDVLSDIYRPVDIERLRADDGVELSMAASFHGFFLTFNTRKFPWDQKALRQAASRLVDRRKWARDLFSGYCEPMSTFLPAISPFCDADEGSRGLVPLRGTGQSPGLDEARRILEKAGWTWNRSGWLVAPDGRELPATEILCPPSSVAATSTEIAALFAEALNTLGVPAEAEPLDFQTMLARIDVGDFDACTNAWTMSRDPDVLFAFYHSSMDVEGGYNMSGISDRELDEALSELRYAPDESAARGASSRAQKILAELCPVIPLYSRYSISAMSKNWDGVFETDRNTSDNFITMISMTSRDGGERPIYWNIPEEIRTLNPLVSSTAYDWTVLGTVYDTLLSVDPYTFEDMPWLAEKWSIETAGDRSVLNFTLRGGMLWQDGRPLTVEDVAYSIQFIKDNDVPRFFDSVKDVESVEFDKDARTLRVTMSNVSYWHLHNIGGGVLVMPKHILENVPEWRAWQPTNRPHMALDGTELTELIGSGPFTFRESRTGEYVHMTRNENYFLFRGDTR